MSEQMGEARAPAAQRSGCSWRPGLGARAGALRGKEASLLMSSRVQENTSWYGKCRDCVFPFVSMGETAKSTATGVLERGAVLFVCRVFQIRELVINRRGQV